MLRRRFSRIRSSSESRALLESMAAAGLFFVLCFEDLDLAATESEEDSDDGVCLVGRIGRSREDCWTVVDMVRTFDDDN